MVRPPKAIVFDLDGTLIDSEPSHKAAEMETFAVLGVPVEEDILLPCTGLTLQVMLERMSEHYGVALTVEQFLDVEKPILGAMVGREIQVFPDADRVIHEIGGIPLAIATSSLPWYVDIVMNRFADLAARFQVLVTAADVENSKPHPEAFLIASYKLGVDPEDVWAIEDSRNGARSAKAAGCTVFGVDRERRGHIDAADVLLPNLNKLIEFL